jgi:two-component system response regulator AtoC
MKVLVVEDDAETRKGLQLLLEEFDLEVRSAPTVAEGRAALAAFDPDVCLTDLQLPDGDGIDFIRAARASSPRREIVVLTGHGSLGTAVEAMKAGAFDYLVKPLRAAQLEAVLERLRPGTPSGEGDADPWKTLDETGRFGAMVGVSEAMREMCAVIARIARSDAPVMITGESGSGKEAAAQTIHGLSRRSAKLLVAINCGAVSSNLIESELFGHEKGAFTGAEKRRAGYFELAQGGTLFLDEVTEMPLDLQVKFLRVLETRTFRRVGGNEEIASDVRIISSSNRDLLEAVEKRVFREDLYYRLNVLPLQVTPLRERRDDVAILANHFLERIAANEDGGRRTFSAGALEKLAAHSWPGNVRELRNAVHRAYVLSDDGVVEESTIAGVLAGRSSGVFAAVRPPAPRAVPPPPPAGADSSDSSPAARASAVSPASPDSSDDPLRVPVRVGDSLEEVEKRLLERTLAAVGGNKKKAAEILRVSLKTVYNKIKQYALEP